MFFPLSVKDVVRDPFDPAGRIDRELSGRNRRLALGTSLNEDWRSVSAALVVATGKGKYLRILNAVTTHHPLPPFTTKLLAEFLSSKDKRSPEDLQTLQSEVALAQAAAIQELKSSAGKYVDRLLVVSISQPDWREPLDCLWPVQLSAAHVLADQTGLSVISNLPDRDLLAGGNGCHLDALPAWILFGDRAARIASINRVVFDIRQTARAFFCRRVTE